MTKPKNLPPRYCQNCGDALRPRAAHNARFCRKNECIAARMKLNHQKCRLATIKEAPIRICAICGQEWRLHGNSKPSRKTCYRPECAQAYRIKKYWMAQEKLRKRKVQCICLNCDQPFATVLVGGEKGEHKVPRYRLCADCRRGSKGELSHVSCWG